MTPSPGSENNPFEFYLIVPAGVAMVHASLRVVNQQYGSAFDRLEVALKEMVARKVDCIVQAGVPPIVMKGWGYQQEALAEIARVTSLPAALDIMACIEVMQKLQMQRGVMVTPFDDEMHDYLARFVKNAGIDVVAARAITAKEHYDPSFVPLAIERLLLRRGAVAV